MGVVDPTLLSMPDATSSLIVLAVSIVVMGIVYDFARAGNRRAQRLSSRLTEVRTMDFLVYLTEALSGGQATALLDELMRYYTSYKATEAERGAETVSTVLDRLEPIKGELLSLLSKARDIDKARFLVERVKSDLRVSFMLSWFFVFASAAMLSWSFVGTAVDVYLIIFGTAILDFALTIVFLYKGIRTVSFMSRAASATAEAGTAATTNSEPAPGPE